MASPDENRWAVLAVLFFARLAMAFQFQAVAAVSPVYMADYGVDLADIGFLIGLYLAPGLLIALPGGAIGRRFGDRRVIAVGMGLMVLGALVMTLARDWEGQVAGRLLSGTGGVLLNVLMTKLVADHFAGHEIATAMGIFVNSWPVGIAAALVILPLLDGGSVVIVQAVVFAATLTGLALFLGGTAPAPESADTSQGERLGMRAALATVVAGAIWGLYNGALAMVFGFGPALLVEKGWTLAGASATTSLVLWAVALSIPAGGLIADRLGRRDTVILVGFLAFAALLAWAPQTGHVTPVFVLLGLCAGLPAGPIMSLPARVLKPATRAVGMGLFFTLFYVGVVFAPLVAGVVSERMGSASGAFYLGAAMLAVCIAALGLFNHLASRRPPAVPAPAI